MMDSVTLQFLVVGIISLVLLIYFSWLFRVTWMKKNSK